MSNLFTEGDIVTVNDSPFLAAKVVEVYGDSLLIEFFHDSELKLWVKPSDVSRVN